MSDTANSELVALFGTAGNQIPTSVYNAAMSQALTWDADGRRPGQDGYTTTYDLAWAAAEVAQAMALLTATEGPHATRISSEGTTMDLTGGTDWAALSLAWRRRSPLAKAAGIGQTLGVIHLDSDVDYVPTSDGVW